MNWSLKILSLMVLSVSLTRNQRVQAQPPSQKGATAIVSQTVFTSPSGFSITPPYGWAVASKETRDQLSSAIRERFQNLGNIDLEKVALVIFNPASGGSESLNVIVLPKGFDIDESNAENEVANGLRDQYSKMASMLGRVSVNRRKFGSHVALVGDMEWSMDGPLLRQWIVMLPAGRHTLIVTCSAPQSSFDEVAPMFTKAIETMTYSNVAGSTFDMPRLLLGGLTGALMGGVIWLFQFLRSRRKVKTSILPG
jgi:hypothetical protein